MKHVKTGHTEKPGKQQYMYIVAPEISSLSFKMTTWWCGVLCCFTSPVFLSICCTCTVFVMYTLNYFHYRRVKELDNCLMQSKTTSEVGLQ